MVPSKIKIESFAKRCHMGTLGGKGLMMTELADSAEYKIHSYRVSWTEIESSLLVVFSTENIELNRIYSYIFVEWSITFTTQQVDLKKNINEMLKYI